MNFQSTIYVENSNNINFIHYATIMLGAKILDKIFDPPKILKKKKKGISIYYLRDFRAYSYS